MHSLGIVQWNSTRRDHPGYPGRVSGTGPVNPSTHRIQVEVGLPDATSENRAESPLYEELYSNTSPA